MISLSALTFMRLVLYYSDVGVRLTGSNVTFAGRVEVLSHGVWGRIDGSSSWDRTEAEVVCRQLGFPGVVTALKYSPFGEGSGPVLMSYVRCTGSEKTLQQCQYRDWFMSYSYKNREVGVICQTHELNTDVRDISIRLQGSSTPNAGRVEVMYAGIWGAISKTKWDLNDATVVCRQLGYHGGAEAAFTSDVYGPMSGPVWITNLQCSGSEANIMSCLHDGIGNKSESQSRRNVASIICKSLSHPNGMLVRLRGSPSPNKGRVEVYYGGMWGSIYASGWDIKDATVVCRQLGYVTASLAGRRLFCSTALPSLFSNFKCYGNESALDQCARDFFAYTWSSSYCANVMCSNGMADSGMLVRLRGSPSPNMGGVEVYYGGIWSSVYDFNWDIKDATVVCRQLGYTAASLTGNRLFCSSTLPSLSVNFRCYGNESALNECAWDSFILSSSVVSCVNVMCSNGATDSGFDVRLTNSAVRHAGRVELRFNGIWGTLYLYPWFWWWPYYNDVTFDGVICRQLNFSGSILTAGSAVFGPGTGPQWYEAHDIRCLGHESNLQNCTLSGQPRLTIHVREYDLSVVCKPSTAQAGDFKVRLTGSRFTFAGTIEVMLYGIWGGVLGMGYIDINAGHVVCRQLGYPGADYISHYAEFGRLNRPLLIWRIHCNGNEWSISDCAVTTWDKITSVFSQNYYQQPDFAAGVLCRQANFNPSQTLKVRLAGAPINNAGRVEVFYSGVWGTIDNWGWDINAVHVVCRQLGYPAGLSSGYNNQFGSSSGPVWFRNVRCLGNETNLGECRKYAYGRNSSVGSGAVTALCKLPYQTDISPNCSEVKCQHHGSCIDTGGGAICNCTEGFTGIHCEKSTSNPCQSSPCKNGGKCFSNESIYICSCPDGLSGHLCEKRTTSTMKPCQNHHCPNDAFCQENETHYSCVFNEAENSASSRTGGEPSPTQTGSTISKTAFVVTLSILASLVFLLVAAVVYLIFQNRRLSKPRHRNQQAAFSNVAFRSDQEETHYCNEIDLGSGTNHSSMPMKDNTSPLYEISPSIEETATSRPLPPIPPPPNAARMNPKAARKKANRRNSGVKPRGATEGPRRATTGAEEHYMALSKESNSTPSRNISADGEPNSNEYMSLSKNRRRDISHS